MKQSLRCQQHQLTLVYFFSNYFQQHAHIFGKGQTSADILPFLHQPMASAYMKVLGLIFPIKTQECPVKPLYSYYSHKDHVIEVFYRLQDIQVFNQISTTKHRHNGGLVLESHRMKVLQFKDQIHIPGLQYFCLDLHSFDDILSLSSRSTELCLGDICITYLKYRLLFLGMIQECCNHRKSSFLPKLHLVHHYNLVDQLIKDHFFQSTIDSTGYNLFFELNFQHLSFFGEQISRLWELDDPFFH